MKKNKTHNFFILFLSLSFLTLAGFLNTKTNPPQVKVTKQESALNVNSKLLSILNAGQTRLLSDILWISTLLESDLDHYSAQDLNSWMYIRFKTISDLDPQFLENYQFGGKYLSIIKDDLYGARIIFEKGLKYYPNDYDLLYNAGFLYASELGNSKRAYEIYSKVVKFPQSPAYLRTLLPKLKLEQTGDLTITYKYLQDLLEVEKDETLKIKIIKDLYAVKATIDLKCLNEEKTQCDTKDYDGKPYIYKDGQYRSIKNFKTYKIHKKK